MAREDCLGAHSFGPGFDRFRFRPVFPRLPTGGFSAGVGGIDTSVDVSIDIPKIPNVDLQSGIPSGIKAKLDEPVDVAPFVPEDSGDVPEFKSALYTAVESVFQYAYDTPLVPKIEYGEGLQHLTPLDAHPDSPPVDYPTEEFISLPPEPDIKPSDLPGVELGDRPKLDRPIRREYVPVDLAPFEVDASEIDALELPDVAEMAWPERVEYDEDEGFRQKLSEILVGSGDIAEWINSVVQSTLVKADTQRLTRETSQKLEQVFQAAAARNLPLASGAVDAQAIRIMDDELNTTFDAAHKVQNEVYEATMNAIVSAVKSSLQVERYHFQLYLGYVKRHLNAYKLNVLLAQTIYNVLAELYNNMRTVIMEEVDAYSQYLSTQQRQIQAQAMEVDIIKARADTLVAEVGLFRTDADTLQLMAKEQQLDVEQQLFPIEEYESMLQGAVANLSIVRHNVASYKQAVQNYAQSGDFYAEQIAGFEAAINAEASKVGVDEANIRNYVKLWGAERQRMAGYEQYIQRIMSPYEAELSRFRQSVATEQKYLGAVAQAVAQSVSKVDAYSSGIRQQGRVYETYNSAGAQYAAGQDRANISQANLDMLQQALVASSQVANARIGAAETGIYARAGGALAQAASSIYNVSVSSMGTASVSADGSQAYSDSNSMSNRIAFSRSCESEVRPMST